MGHDCSWQEAEADATADKEDAVTGASKPPMKANDDDGMLEKICKALSEVCGLIHLENMCVCPEPKETEQTSSE